MLLLSLMDLSRYENSPIIDPRDLAKALYDQQQRIIHKLTLNSISKPPFYIKGRGLSLSEIVRVLLTIGEFAQHNEMRIGINESNGSILLGDVTEAAAVDYRGYTANTVSIYLETLKRIATTTW